MDPSWGMNIGSLAARQPVAFFPDPMIESWLVVTGTMEFWMTFQKQLGMSAPPNWLSLHEFSEG